MLPPDTVLKDRYRLIEPVGEGGMATVYRAHDSLLGRDVAIKVLHPEYERDAPFVQRFVQEAQFAASLGSHPNIVAIFDVGEDNGVHFMVMELVEGRDLKDLIRERAPFTVPEAFSIGRQVASALDFAHRRGLIHRDVKPQNIMVTPDGVAKVTDFGIAYGASATQLTRTGMVIGTVHYFSPEQARGTTVTPASDIYSLGVILYEMLTAHLPFDAENAIGIAMQHIHSEPPSPWEFNPELPARAVAVVMRALEKEPERRYRDAAEFAAALAPFTSTDLGATTVMAPLPPQDEEATTVFTPPPAPRPVRQPTGETVVRRPVRAPSAGTSRTVETGGSSRVWMYLAGGLILVIAIALASYFAANAVMGNSSPTDTPTPTKTPKPKPTRKPTRTPRPRPTATTYVYVAPTSTYTATPFPTWTPTATPRPTPRPTARPTRTPVPVTPTPKPNPKPTATSAPIMTPTPQPGPAPTETLTPTG
jgi:eukaryotic-like serine/threonine-protein kinase